MQKMCCPAFKIWDKTKTVKLQIKLIFTAERALICERAQHFGISGSFDLKRTHTLGRVWHPGCARSLCQMCQMCHPGVKRITGTKFIAAKKIRAKSSLGGVGCQTLQMILHFRLTSIDAEVCEVSWRRVDSNANETSQSTLWLVADVCVLYQLALYDLCHHLWE